MAAKKGVIIENCREFVLNGTHFTRKKQYRAALYGKRTNYEERDICPVFRLSSWRNVEKEQKYLNSLLKSEKELLLDIAIASAIYKAKQPKLVKQKRYLFKQFPQLFEDAKLYDWKEGKHNSLIKQNDRLKKKILKLRDITNEQIQGELVENITKRLDKLIPIASYEALLKKSCEGFYSSTRWCI